MFQPATGGKLFKAPPRSAGGFLVPGKWMDIGCGQCMQCRIKRKAEWNLKLSLELQACVDKEAAYFLTLTYDDEHLPLRGDFCYSDFQLFMKRLRKHMLKAENGGFDNIRFFMVAERGERNGRVHYHALLFNLRFFDAVPKGISSRGTREIRSESEALTRVWGKGFAELGTVTQHSIDYCANYVVDKVNGKLAEKHYERIDPDTGEVYSVQREFARMSNRPGIGAMFYDKYKHQLLQGFTVHPSKLDKVSLPRSFRKKLHTEFPDEYEVMTDDQIAKFQARDAAMRQNGDSIAKDSLRKERILEIKIAQSRREKRL
jgi:hypothetical protein